MATFGDDLLFINEDSVMIDTGLSTREAAQAKLMQFLTEPGYIAEVKADGSVSFEPYTFTDSHEEIAKGRKNESVFISGPAYKGIPFMEILQGEDTEKARLIAEKICKITEAALEKEIKLPNNGPLGTIAGEDGTILFLPPTLFNRALDSRGDSTYSFYEGCWKNTALSENDCLRFTAAAYAYTVYAGKSPFPEKDSQKRAADFYDKNFEKLSWFCKLQKNGDIIDSKAIFSQIEQNLSCSAPEMDTSKKKKKKKKLGIKSTSITELPSFDKRVISDSSTLPAYELQQKNIKRVRFFRKNGTIIKVCVVALIVLCIAIVSHIKNLMSRPNTLGKEPAQVVDMFYEGFDTLDTILFDATRTNGAGDGISNVIAAVFVTAKMRESYEGKQIYTPSQWLNLKNPDQLDIYGLTQLKIEGEEEKNKEGINCFKAHYYVLHTENLELFVSEVNDELTLTYEKDRWLISDFVSEDHEIKIDSEAFYNDLREVAPANSPYKAADVINALSGKYPWLPTVEETDKGYEQLFAAYQ